MKLKTFLLVTVAAAVVASAALAAPPTTHPGNGAKPPTTGAGCKPQIAIVLRGTVAAAPGASPTLPFALMVTATHANHHGQAYVKPTETQPITVTVTAATKVSRQGDASLGSLLAGDRVNVQARVCKADLANGATPGLTATRVTAQPAKS